jgi:hypothetical protein
LKSQSRPGVTPTKLKSESRCLSSRVSVRVPKDASGNYPGPVAQRLEQGTHNPLVGGSNPSGPTIFDQDGHKFADRLHQRVVTRFKFKEEEIRFSWRRHGLRPRGAGFSQVRFGETQPDRPPYAVVARPTPERRLHYRHSAPWCSLCSGNRAAHQRWDS